MLKNGSGWVVLSKRAGVNLIGRKMNSMCSLLVWLLSVFGCIPNWVTLRLFYLFTTADHEFKYIIFVSFSTLEFIMLLVLVIFAYMYLNERNFLTFDNIKVWFNGGHHTQQSKINSTHTHTHTHAQTHTYTHTLTYIHTHTHTHTYIHKHTYIHTHTHTYTHIHTNRNIKKRMRWESYCTFNKMVRTSKKG